MISSVKQSTPANFTGSDLFRRRSPAPTQQFSLLRALPEIKQRTSALSVGKPLHLSTVEGFTPLKKRSVECKAYEADRSRPIDSNIEIPVHLTQSEAAKKVKIGIYFATWWALNVVFNIYNKKVLNVFPYPWLTSTLSLATGSLMMLISWATRIAEAPKTNFEFWKTLFPVSCFRVLGQFAVQVFVVRLAFSEKGEFYFFLLLCASPDRKLNWVEDLFPLYKFFIFSAFKWRVKSFCFILILFS